MPWGNITSMTFEKNQNNRKGKTMDNPTINNFFRVPYRMKKAGIMMIDVRRYPIIGVKKI